MERRSTHTLMLFSKGKLLDHLNDSGAVAVRRVGVRVEAEHLQIDRALQHPFIGRGGNVAGVGWEHGGYRMTLDAGMVMALATETPRR